MTRDADLAIELERQQALMASLWSGSRCEVPADLRDAVVPAARGLQAYRINAGATAERALAAVYPVVHALVGVEAFAGLARAFWLARPPRRGDLAWLGETLADFIATDERLHDVPYLADVARLEWALARARAAADAGGTAAERLSSLALLAEHDACELFLDLAPGAAVIRSRWPVGAICRMHRDDAEPGAAALAREALETGLGETVFVWRHGWAPRMETIDEACARFVDSLLAGAAVSRALACACEADAGWSFEAWLARAVRDGWHAGARRLPVSRQPP